MPGRGASRLKTVLGNAFGTKSNRETRVWSSHDEVCACRGSLRLHTTSEVGVGIEMWRDHCCRIVDSDPPHHSEVVGAVDVAHETVKLPITCLVPLGDEACKVAYSSQHVRARHSY